MSAEQPSSHEPEIKEPSARKKLVDIFSTNLEGRLFEIQEKLRDKQNNDSTVMLDGELAQLRNLFQQIRIKVGSSNAHEVIDLDTFDLDMVVITQPLLTPMLPDEFISTFYEGVRHGSQYVLDSLQLVSPTGPSDVLNPWKREFIEEFFPGDKRIVDNKEDSLLAIQDTRIPGINVELFFGPEQHLPQRALVVDNRIM